MTAETLASFATTETLLSTLPTKNQTWQDPVGFDLNDPDRHAAFNEVLTGGGITVHDPIEAVANDYFEHAHPEKIADENERQAFVAKILGEGAAYGNWFLYPDTGNLFHFPPQDVHERLLSSRNNPLITPDEQAVLRQSYWAVLGESVGSHVILSGLHSGSFGKIAHGDPDYVSLPNLNRMGLTYGSVGARKIDEISRIISETNPYVQQQRFEDGYDQKAKEMLLNAKDKPTIIFDAVDNLAVKASLRKTAQEIGSPLVMVTDLGYKSIVDVERYDTGDKKAIPFGGRLDGALVDDLADGQVSVADQGKMLTKVTGVRHASPRLLMAAAERGKSLVSFPQLETIAEIGGAVGDIVAQEIALGRKLPSGRYVVSVRDALKLGSPDTTQKKIEMVRHFIRWQVDLKKS